MPVQETTGPADGTLVEQAVSGDLDAFRVLFERHQRRIYSAVYAVVGRAADAEDITQDAFVKAYRALGSLREGQAFLSWLYRIALNLGPNHVGDRRAGLWQARDVEGEWGYDTIERQVADESPDPATLVESQEVRDVVRDAIRELSPAHQEVIVLHHLQGIPVEEIARIAGCSVGTVKSRLSRGREVLKRKLRGYVLAE